MSKQKYPHVGRPTNEEIKQRKEKQNLKIISICLLILTLGIGMYFGINYIHDKLSNSNTSQNGTMDDDGFNIIASGEYASGEYASGENPFSGVTSSDSKLVLAPAYGKVNISNKIKEAYISNSNDTINFKNATKLEKFIGYEVDLSEFTNTSKLNKLKELSITNVRPKYLDVSDLTKIKAPNLTTLKLWNAGLFNEALEISDYDASINLKQYSKLQKLTFYEYGLTWPETDFSLNLSNNKKLKEVNITFDVETILDSADISELDFDVSDAKRLFDKKVTLPTGVSVKKVGYSCYKCRVDGDYVYLSASTIKNYKNGYYDNAEGRGNVSLTLKYTMSNGSIYNITYNIDVNLGTPFVEVVRAYTTDGFEVIASDYHFRGDELGSEFNLDIPKKYKNFKVVVYYEGGIVNKNITTRATLSGKGMQIARFNTVEETYDNNIEEVYVNVNSNSASTATLTMKKGIYDGRCDGYNCSYKVYPSREVKIKINRK